jgi:hypothetical protein
VLGLELQPAAPALRIKLLGLVPAAPSIVGVLSDSEFSKVSPLAKSRSASCSTRATSSAFRRLRMGPSVYAVYRGTNITPGPNFGEQTRFPTCRPMDPCLQQPRVVSTRMRLGCTTFNVTQCNDRWIVAIINEMRGCLR